MIECPHCCREITEDDTEARELSNGRDFYIAVMFMRGYWASDLAGPLGVKPGVVAARWAIIMKKYGKQCGFFTTSRRKDGKVKLLSYYDHNGMHVSVCRDKEMPGRYFGAVRDLHERKHLGHVELDDWANRGYVFHHGYKTAAK